MKKLLTNLSFLLIIGTLLVFFAGCNGDENEGDPVNNLLGLWTVSTIEIDAKVGNQRLVDYLVDEAGFSELDAAIWATLLDEAIMDELDPNGTIDIKADNTYISNFDGPDDGTWKLSADNNTLTLDEGTSDETDLAVNSLTSSLLSVTQADVYHVDHDEDPLTSDLEINVELTMTLAK